MVENSESTGYKIGKGKPPLERCFKPGQSGNPKGRPRKLLALDKLLNDLLGEEGKDGITAAEMILRALCKRTVKGDVRAAEVLLDRAYGKAKQFVETTSLYPSIKIEMPPGMNIIFPSNLTGEVDDFENYNLICGDQKDVSQLGTTEGGRKFSGAKIKAWGPTSQIRSFSNLHFVVY